MSKRDEKPKLPRHEALHAARTHVEQKIKEGMSRDLALNEGARMISKNTGRSKSRERVALMDLLDKVTEGQGPRIADCE